MSEQTYALREIAPILARTARNASPVLILRQVRHWTIHDLLKATRKHTGRGRDRKYALHELRKAAVYLELSHYGMTVGLLEGVGDWLDMLEEEQHPVWTFAKEGKVRVFVQAMWGPDETLMCSLSVHPDDMAKAKRAIGKKRLKILPAGVGALSQDRIASMGVHSLILVDLHGLFRCFDA